MIGIYVHIFAHTNICRKLWKYMKMVYFHVLPCCDQPDSQPSNTSVARRGSFQGSRAPDLNANPGVWGGSRLDPAGFRCVQRGEP